MTCEAREAMKIYGVCVVQNEADVIRDSVQWATRFCDRIWVWDLGSADGTWDVLDSLRSPKIEPSLREIPYSSSLRGRIFNEVRDQIEDGSWLYILDADEFLVGDPRPVLARAEESGAEVVGVWQANFFPVAPDLERLREIGEEAWSAIPLEQRLSHYRVEWFEWRFVRISKDLVWDTSKAYNVTRHADGRELRRFGPSMCVRHYRYRSPAQVALRFRTRRAEGGVRRFGYDRSAEFAGYVRPAAACVLWDGLSDLQVPQAELRRARLRRLATLTLRRVQRTVRRLAPSQVNS